MKLIYLQQLRKQGDVIKLMVSKMSSLDGNVAEPPQIVENPMSKLYGFTPSAVPLISTKNDDEANQFIRDPDLELHSLHRYPVVKKVYLRYNTPVPSAAPVERLFSFASMIYAPKRQNLSSETFQKLVMLKANHSIL